MQLQLAHIHQRVHALARVLKVATLRVVATMASITSSMIDWVMLLW
jgi:hypothetical protein